MRIPQSQLVIPLVAVSVLAASASPREESPASSVDNEWFRAWPPAGVAYSFPSQIRKEGASLGEADTIQLQATYIHSVTQSDTFNWLLGADWQRVRTSVPAGALLPSTLQSVSAVAGFDWFFHDGWHARFESLPGIYSDFEDVSGNDFNVPFFIEVSHAFGPNLLLGGQLNVNARRKSPVLGAVGARWKIAEDWLLSLWFPRPRVEYFALKHMTLFLGATFTGGTFVVADDFGDQKGQPDLNGQPVDYQETRVGGGVRYEIQDRLGLEISGGWSVDRNYDFFDRDLELEIKGTPYVQFGFGLMF